MGAGARLPLRSPVFLWGPVLLQMAVIFGVSSLHNVGRLPGGMSDKVGHTIGYVILGAALLRALARGRLSGVTWVTALVAMVLTTMYGVSDEIHQMFVPGRTADPMDVLADGVGATLAAALGGLMAAARAWGILSFSSRSREER
jgi:hypothetical protein